MIRSHSTIATPPGATIKEQLVDRGMSQKEFAERMDLSEKHISKLVNGEVQLTSDVAVRLEMVLGIPAQFWCKLESIYREKLVKANAENEMDADIELMKKFPYKEMASQNWIAKTTNVNEKVINLRKFFEVVKLTLVQNSLHPSIACRRVSETEKADYALIAWAQKAKLDARNIETSAINLKKLSSSLSEIRSMTRLDPEEFCPRLVSLLANCGVALVFLPHIGGSFLHGATFYDKNKIVVGLTVRGKDADKFWFSLFHEIAHILYGHIAQADGTSEEDEVTANIFARDTLIPFDKFQYYTSQCNFNRESILDFARSVNVDPGIVVGRLQKDNFIEYSWYNDLKTKYQIL
ncbi:MAG: HigA family addiction module antidote protein [Lachnospiraceae bacterium]|nr:HigA family addiction module antidote protein [Lachnospiraceae bacterium]